MLGLWDALVIIVLISALPKIVEAFRKIKK